MNTMTYKRYVGTVEFSREDGLLFGRVLGIDDVIDYEGSSVEELERDFHNAIDFYLEACKKRGRMPNRARGGQITLTLPVEVELRLEQAVEETGKSAKALVLDAIQAVYSPSNEKNASKRRAKTKRGRRAAESAL